MAHTRTWDAAAEAVPAATADIKDGDDAIRNLKVDIRERMAVDHYMDITGTDADHGEHQKITFRSQIAKPAAVANKMFVYTRDVAGKVELFIEDEDGHEIQLTSGGAIIAGNATTAVTATNLSGGTVSGTTGAFSGKLQVVNPYFFAYITSNLDNVTGDNTVYPLTGAIWTEVSDLGGYFTDGIFTAAYTGKYLFSGTLSLTHANCDSFRAYLVTSNRSHTLSPYTNTLRVTDWGYLEIPFFKIADMEAGDTAYLSLRTNLASPLKYTDIQGSGRTQFYGYLLP